MEPALEERGDSVFGPDDYEERVAAMEPALEERGDLLSEMDEVAS